MTDSQLSEEELIEDKHLKLSKWAQIANILAWIFLAIAIAQTIIYIPLELAQEKQFDEFMGRITSKTFFENIAFYLGIVSLLLKNLVSVFIFKAISLGLYMLIEIDLNYKLSRKE